jgi:hypothetical protein
MGSMSPAAGASAATSPTEAALRLQSLLGEHSILATDMMRARIRGDADLAGVANAALGKNASAMAALLTPILSASDRQTFATVWGQHIQALFEYSRGLSTHDTAAQTSARADLTRFENQLADFFVGHSSGRLNQAAARTAVRTHIDHLLAGADAYAAKNYTVSAQLYRMSYSHTFDLGGILAHVLLPDAAAKQLDTPTVKLRAALTKLLGEHVGLVIGAMRSAVGDSADFAAMGVALNGNTTDLTAAMGSLFGSAAARGFQNYWSDHVDQLMAYTRATVQHDAAGQERARVALRSFEQGFATFLSGATQHRLGQPALDQAYVMHDRQLLAEIDAYAAKTFQQAHDLADQTYQDMFTVSAQLSAAIGATLAGKLPRGGSQTGGGGMARTVARW